MIEPMQIAKSGQTLLSLLPALTNRHGLITGATGTGKTVTLQVIAEQLSSIGVPVFMADVKGDLTGLSAAGSVSPKFQARLDKLGITAPQASAFPVTLWDVFGEQGHPLRATVSDMGPLLLSRMLGLNDTQEGVLSLVFKIADERGLLLLDSKDLRAMLQYVGENAREFTTEYGNVSTASIGAIQRAMLRLSEQGGDKFLGEPMLNLDDLLKVDSTGRGVINILAADKLMNAPQLYATFLLWLLSELFEQLPEVGDADKPKLVFFFDEAHLLFSDAPKSLLQKIEQVVRLIRSKGVGVFFVTQNPLDVPDAVVGQLGNRVQHALRAFTARDQKAVQAAADTLRANPAFNAAQVITELEVGEALVSMLDEKGRPCIVERAFVLPPASRIGPIDDAERRTLRQTSAVAGVYETTLDRESAYEKLKGGAANTTTPDKTSAEHAAANDASKEPDAARRQAPTDASAPAQTEGGGFFGDLLEGLGGMFGGGGARSPRARRTDSVVDSLAKSAARSIGTTVGREIVRGVLGSILGGRRR